MARKINHLSAVSYTHLDVYKRQVVELENKILNSDDNDDSIVKVENGRETDQLNENKDDQVTEKEVSKDSINGNNEVTDDIGVKTGENDGNKMTKNNGNISDNSNGDSLSANKVIIDKVSGNNSDNYNDERITNNNQVIVDKVTEVNTSVILSDNSNVVENEVSKNDTVNSNSNDESRKLFGVSNRVVISVDE